MFSAQKTILVLSDDAVAVYAPVRGRYSFLGEVKWGDPEFLSTLSELLAMKGRSRPIMVLYDMVEQYYRKEVVPKVALLDQRRVIERRLTASFPNYPLRAFLPLKVDKKAAQAISSVSIDRTGEKTKATEGAQYLFAALPDLDQMSRVTDAVRLSMTVAKSLVLLPVESVSMVKQLSAVLNDGNTSAERWTVFMAQHRGGGLRQIVVRNGELALTRLTPIVDTDIEPNIWANEVAQEFSATMGYLSRFGYNNNSELEIIMLGNSEALAQLQPQVKATYFHGLSVREAARALRLNVDADDDLRYGDVLHVAWLARKMRVTLPFIIKELSFVSRARTGARAVASILTCAAIGTMIYSGYQAWNLYQAQQKYAQAQEVLKSLETEYTAEIKRKEEFNIDVKLVQGSIAIFDRLEKNRVDILDFLQAVSRGTGPDIAYDRIQMGYQVIKEDNPDPMAVQVVEKKVFGAKLDLSFSSSIKPELGNKVVSDLRDRIDRELDETFVVSVDQPVRDLTFRTAYKYEAGQEAGSDLDNTSQRLTAVIGITKRPIEQ